jgi:hypothetical protein
MSQRLDIGMARDVGSFNDYCTGIVRDYGAFTFADKAVIYFERA